MTNDTVTTKLMNSKSFYASRKNSPLGKPYLTPNERKVLREKKDSIKCLANSLSLTEIQNRSDFREPYLTETIKSTCTPETIATSAEKCYHDKENSMSKPSKLYPIFYLRSPQNSPPKKIQQKSKLSTVAPVSPQALQLSLTGTPKTRRSIPLNESPKKQQLIIDAGQKAFGAIQCKLCGMVYTVSLPHDQKQHAVFHKRFLDSVKFTGWKKERIALTCPGGRVLKIVSSDPKYALNKVNEICSLIDVDLGFENPMYFAPNSTKIVYLFISNKHQVAGCVVAEPISRAFRLSSSSENHHTVSTCFSKAEKVSCGISRIWTYYPYRRKGIASCLVDVVRSTFVLGSQLEKGQIAFSDPTADGIYFATKYCQTKEFLTYNLSRQW